MLSVIPSEVENGAAREVATWTGRPQAERAESERIKSPGATQTAILGGPSTSLRSAQDDTHNDLAAGGSPRHDNRWIHRYNHESCCASRK
jgi:hypothetical protein